MGRAAYTYTPAACCWPFVWNFSLDKNT